MDSKEAATRLENENEEEPLGQAIAFSEENENEEEELLRQAIALSLEACK